MTTHDYEINENLVSTNPERIIFHQDKHSYCDATLAFNGSEWACGFEVDLYTRGNGCLPGFGKYCNTYPTRESALDAAISHIKSVLQHFIQDYGLRQLVLMKK
jgi:hypothetical protein